MPLFIYSPPEVIFCSSGLSENSLWRLLLWICRCYLACLNNWCLPRVLLCIFQPIFPDIDILYLCLHPLALQSASLLGTCGGVTYVTLTPDTNSWGVLLWSGNESNWHYLACGGVTYITLSPDFKKNKKSWGVGHAGQEVSNWQLNGLFWTAHSPSLQKVCFFSRHSTHNAASSEIRPHNVLKPFERQTVS